jgi:folate-binding protein YgfZ
LWEELTKAGARPVGQEAFEVLRIEAGVPRYGVDVSETNVVLEAVREDDAVSYTKGCYIGQEIIARIHWRGHVAKRLAGIVLEENTDLGADAKVRTADGKERNCPRASLSCPSCASINTPRRALQATEGRRQLERTAAP